MGLMTTTTATTNSVRSSSNSCSKAAGGLLLRGARRGHRDNATRVSSPPRPRATPKNQNLVKVAHVLQEAKATSASTSASFTELDKLRLSTVNRYAQERKNSIIAVGLTVHTAPVEVREKLAVAESEWNECVSDLTAYPHVDEACILSTCNRMELYCNALSWHRGVKEVEDWLSKRSGVPVEELRPYLFLLRDRDAIRHLLRVSGGLDSLVMGEGQILAQVKNVHRLGTEYEQEVKSGAFGRHLNALFKQAIQAGKRVRSETDIASGAVSVSSAAAELCQMKLPSNTFDGAKVCIVGAGTMSKLLVKHLFSKGCTEMTVVNRSMPRCLELQEEFPEVKFTFELSPKLMDCVKDADVVFAASSSDTILITKEDVEPMGECSEAVGGVRRFFDISVPRNIDPAITELDHGHAYNVDDLKEVVEANKAQRAAAAAEAELLIVEEIQGYEAWRDSLETVPTIKKLRTKAEDIRRSELDKALNKVGEGLSKKEKRVLEDLSKGIVNKLLHGPMAALRCDAGDPESVAESIDNMHALENMFDLKNEEEDTKKMLERAGRK
ncbi:glutamyl-tRNA reductase [Chloropicon primus]|nr:glutamyl-tRNA reductase [Chloropicon primus]